MSHKSGTYCVLLKSEFPASPPMSRFNAETEEKKLFLNWCQQEGILEVLPYHECDKVPGARPDYLSCLVRLQVQNISARHAVFITGETLLHQYITCANL